MDSSELHKLHKSMWNWLARNPSKKKHQWPGWRCARIQDDDKLYTARINECFACQDARNTAVTRVKPPFDCCTACPIDWGIKIRAAYCESKGTLYRTWQRSNDMKQKAHIAKLIANIEWINKEDLES